MSLRHFAAELDYRTATGLVGKAQINSTFPGSSPQDAFFTALIEMASIAALQGWGDAAIDAVTTRVADIRKVQADVRVGK